MATTVFDLQAILGIDTSGYEQGLKAASGMASSIGSGIGTAMKVGVAAVSAATTALGGFVAASVNTGKEFDASMSQVAATMAEKADAMVEYNGQTMSAFDALRDYAQEMGRTTVFSATQAADALNYMALAGYNAEQSMAMLPNVLNLAAAGNMDLAKASDMVTDASTAFGLSVEENGPRITQMVDEMAKAASTGNTSVEQLGDAFLTVGGLAAELNGGLVTLEDGTTASVDGIQELEIALTGMANAGIKGSEAGTHMRNMLLKLSSPTSDGAQALEAMGVSVFDLEGNMRSLKDVFGDLSGAMSTMTQEEKIQTISDLFNTRDLASAEALLNAVGQDWDKIGEAIVNADGAAEQMAGRQMDNLAGDVKMFKSALEGAQIAISDMATGPLREFVQLGTEGLSDVTSAFKEGGFEAGVQAFGDFLANAINMVIEKLPSFVDAGMKMLGALGQGLLDNLPAIVNAAIQIATQLGQGLVQALPQLIKGAITVIKALAQALVSHAGDILQAGMEIFTALLQGMVDFLPDLLAMVGELIQNVIDFLTEKLPEFIPVIIDLLTRIPQIFLDNLPMLLNGLIQLILALANALMDAIPLFIEKLPLIINAIITAMLNQIPMLIIGIIQLITGILQHLPEIIVAIIEAIPMIFMAIVDAFMGLDWLGLGGSLIQAIADGIMALIMLIPDTLVMIGQDAINWLTNLEWFQLGMNFITWIVNGLINLVLEIPKKLEEIAKNAISYVKNLDWVQVGKDMIIGMIRGIGQMASEFIDAIVDLCEDAWDEVKDFFGIESPSKLMAYAGRMIDEGLVKGIEQESALPVRAMEAMAASVSSVPMNAAFEGGYGYGEYGEYGQNFTQINNIYSPEPLSPSETARLTRNATRDMVLELRGRR